MVITMSDIEVILKILLLIVTIGYTAFKWLSAIKKHKNGKDK